MKASWLAGCLAWVTLWFQSPAPHKLWVTLWVQSPAPHKLTVVGGGILVISAVKKETMEDQEIEIILHYI